jgi:hypothetical protein
MKPIAFAAALAAMSLTAAPGLAQVTAPEGTAFPLRLEDTLSSRTAEAGDRFTFTLANDVRLPDGTVLPAGYRGVGEITDVRRNGLLGRTGKLRIRLDYLKVGDEEIPLRAVRGAKGDHRTGAQVVSVLLLWPVAPFIKGKDTAFRQGTMITAYADTDVRSATPIAAPPSDL